jgi:hypothetical protein
MLGFNAQFELFLLLLFVDEFMFPKGKCTTFEEGGDKIKDVTTIKRE